MKLKKAITCKKAIAICIMAFIIFPIVACEGTIIFNLKDIANIMLQSGAASVDHFEESSGMDMTLDDVRRLAAKGYDLQAEDFLKYKGTNGTLVDSLYDDFTTVYDVRGGHHLIVRATQDGIIDIVNFECKGQISVNGIKNGIGIDIRLADVDEYLRNYSDLQ